VNRSGNDIIGESRVRLLGATVLMDEGKFRESVEESIRCSELALEAMLVSWDMIPSGCGCQEMMEAFRQRSRVVVSPWLMHCCRRIDLHNVFYGECDSGKSEKIFDEEYAMEIVNYGRDVLKFAQRNVWREEQSDQP
jgi:HEPN domain-containing protein